MILSIVPDARFFCQKQGKCLCHAPFAFIIRRHEAFIATRKY